MKYCDCGESQFRGILFRCSRQRITCRVIIEITFSIIHIIHAHTHTITRDIQRDYEAAENPPCIINLSAGKELI